MIFFKHIVFRGINDAAKAANRSNHVRVMRIVQHLERRGAALRGFQFAQAVFDFVIRGVINQKVI